MIRRPGNGLSGAGRRITVKFGVALTAQRRQGSCCQALLEQVAQALMERGPCGPAVEKWSAGRLPRPGQRMFWGKLQAVCRGMLVAGMERVRIGGLTGEER